MKLQSITIENFKSIKKLELNLSDNLYCLIGKNESGKSNILQAIALLEETFQPSNPDQEKKLNRILKSATITGRFEILQSEKNEVNKILRLARPANTPAFQVPSKVNEQYRVENIKCVHVEVRKDLSANNTYLIELLDGSSIVVKDIADKTKADQFITGIIRLMPSISYYANEEFLIRPVSPEELLEISNDSSLMSFKKLFALGGLDDIKRLASDSVEEIIEIRESVAQRVNSLLKKYYRQDNNLKIRIESHLGKFSLHFTDDFHPLNSLEDRSTGFQYFFSFLINKIYLKEFGKNEAIYLLDEPGLTLHPTGQKDFVKLLEEISTDNQLLYTTHSPFSINRMKPTRVWVIEKDVKRGTYLNPKPYQKNWRPLRSSLGIDISDSFFYGDRSLLVEGPEDRIYIGCLFNYFSNRGSINLNSDLLSIIDSGSINNMPAMVQILLDEERPLFVFIDDDDASVYRRLKKKEEELKNPEMLTIKKTSDIFKEAVSIEDLIPHELYIQAVENYLNYLLQEEVITLSTPEMVMPNLREIKPPKKYQSIAAEITKSFLNSDGTALDSKTPISKVGIAHEFEKLLNTAEKFGNEQEEQSCLELVKLISQKLGL